MTFGQRLKDLRTQFNMTQQELADQCHIARSTLGMYEQDRRHPDFESLDALADFFDVNFDYLLGRTDTNLHYPRHHTHEAHMALRLSAYAEILAAAYEQASPDTQAAVRAILHLPGGDDGDR